MHNNYCNQLLGQWYNGYIPQGSDFSAIDGNLAAGLNGDGGGTYAPSSPIFIVNLWAAGPWVLSGTATAVGENPLLFGGTGSSFVYGDSDYSLTAGSSTIATSVGNGIANGTTGGAVTSFAPSLPALRYSTGGVPGVPGNGVVTIIAPRRIVIPIHPHQGATLIEVVLTIVITQGLLGVGSGVRDTIPAHLPAFRFCIVDFAGNASFVTGIGTDEFGWYVLPTPSSVAAYYDSGNSQQFPLAFNAAPVMDDQHLYFLEITDEFGAGAFAGNVFQDVTCVYDGIVDTRPW
jgi:hypothetical protein